MGGLVVNKKWLIGSSVGFAGIAVVGVLWWAVWGRFYQGTDDAYVHGNQVRLTPQISGYVKAIYAEDTELVEEGQILVELDATDRTIAFEKAKNELALKVREVTQLFETAYVIAGEYEKSQANLVEMEVLFANRKEVVESGAISIEEFITAETNYYAAQASLISVQYQLMRALSEIQNTTIETHPIVEKAKTSLREAYVNLQRCILKSPVAGIIAQRKVQVGGTVDPTSALMAIIPLNQMWIEANYKEVDLTKIRIGQSAHMTADIYGRDVVYTGEVVGIGIGSGAVFSPLPPQNATGNWIKIVQRIPVRISLSQEQLRQNPLRLGLSMHVDVDLHDMSGTRVPQKSMEKPVYQTYVFNSQMAGVEQVIEQIIRENQTFE